MQDTRFGAITALREGARVALVAPAGVVRHDHDIERACDNVRSFGWTPILGEHVRDQAGYLAGTDADRLHDINAAFASDEVDAIWCLRGGYGTLRLLATIDYPALRRRPRPVIGFSDITALHSAIHRQCGIVTFHGPTARSTLTEFSRESLASALVEQRDPCGAAPAARVLRSGRATGRVVGGNLALITALLGTPFAPNFDGAILILEDIGEAIYRIDRMLRQLILAGALQRCAAIVAGDFRPPRDEVPADNRTLDEVLTEAATLAGIPCLAGAPFGHIADQWTVPLGAIAELDTDARTLRVLSGT
jgi:muramoyltetrapeptide carboxypeptidase